MATLVALVPLLLLSYFSVAAASKTVNRQVRSALETSSQSSALLLNGELISLQKIVESYARRPGLRATLGVKGLGSTTESLGFQLKEVTRAYPGITVAFAATPTGRLLGIYPATPAIIGKNYQFRDWYKGVMRTNKTYISSLYRTQATGHGFVVAVATPVRDRQGHRCLPDR